MTNVKLTHCMVYRYTKSYLILDPGDFVLLACSDLFQGFVNFSFVIFDPPHDILQIECLLFESHFQTFRFEPPLVFLPILLSSGALVRFRNSTRLQFLSKTSHAQNAEIQMEHWAELRLIRPSF